MLRTFALIAVALLTVTPAAQGGAYTNDAGSGRDAPSNEAEAIAIGYGTHTGYMLPRDTDWFRAPATSGVSCVEATANVGGVGNLVLRGAGHEAVAGFADGATSVALAFSSGATPTLAVVNTLRDYSNHGAYSLSVASAGFFGDDGSGLDVGDSAATARAIDAGCVTGTVGGLGDLGDLYTFQVPEGGDLLVSLAAPAGVELELLSPTGEQLGAVADGQLLTIPGLTAGSYSMRASALDLGTSPYAFGLIIRPPGPGCKPNC